MTLRDKAVKRIILKNNSFKNLDFFLVDCSIRVCFVSRLWPCSPPCCNGLFSEGNRKISDGKNNNADLSPFTVDPYINNDKRKLNQSLIRILKVRKAFLMFLTAFRDVYFTQFGKWNVLRPPSSVGLLLVCKVINKCIY